MLEENPYFTEEFKRVFNNSDIPEADDFTQEVLKDTYLDIEIALPIYGEGTEFSKVKKPLRDENGIPIGRQHDNPILDTRAYEVEYLDGHKA